MSYGMRGGCGVRCGMRGGCGVRCGMRGGCGEVWDEGRVWCVMG